MCYQCTVSRALLYPITYLYLVHRFHESGRDDPAKVIIFSYTPHWLSSTFSQILHSLCQACAPYITKAQELIVPLLHLPTNDVCTGLLLLAWACYGQVLLLVFLFAAGRASS